MSERLGELLVKADRITPEQLDMGLQNQRQNGGRLGTSLVELGFITHRGDEEQLTSKSAQQDIARALADTIADYFEETGRRIAVMEGRD